MIMWYVVWIDYLLFNMCLVGSINTGCTFLLPKNCPSVIWVNKFQIYSGNRNIYFFNMLQTVRFIPALASWLEIHFPTMSLCPKIRIRITFEWSEISQRNFRYSLPRTDVDTVFVRGLILPWLTEKIKIF